MSKSPRVAVVILNWQNATDTLDCLASVAKLNYDNYQTIVVDNGSNDDSVVSIQTTFPEITLIALPENVGYAAGNNVGIHHGIDEGAEYVFVLNNDTLLASDMLQKLVVVLEENPQVGMVGPKMYCYQPDDVIFAAGSVIHWQKGNIFHRGMFVADTSWSDISHPEPVDFITGCGVLVRKSLIEIAGALDLSYFLNFEDVEWCVRARRMGFDVWYAPDAVMWHKISATLGESSPANTYYMTRNSLFFFWHNSPFGNRWATVFRIIVRTLHTSVAWSVKKQYHNEKYHRLRQVNLLALRDFFRGKLGKMGEDVAAVCYGRLN
jgi:GT2 family glycosyltransferase